jgi:hypothetical protein
MCVNFIEKIFYTKSKFRSKIIHQYLKTALKKQIVVAAIWHWKMGLILNRSNKLITSSVLIQLKKMLSNLYIHPQYKKIPMKHLPYLILVFLFSGCISSKKYARFVKENYSNRDTVVAKPTADITVHLRRQSAFDTVVSVKKGSTYFIPALFYWGVKESFNCELNPRIPLNIFRNECNSYANTAGLTKKLNGRRLELEINGLPGKFTYVNNLDVIIAVVFYTTITLQAIRPEEMPVVVSYKLYDGKTVTREGKLELANFQKPMVNNWKSTRKVTWAYLSQYEYSMKMLAQQCMTGIARDL